MTARIALIKELHSAIQASTSLRRDSMAEKLAELFVGSAKDYSNETIQLFDDVFSRLVAHIEFEARIRLAQRLSMSPFSPPATSRLLAGDDAIEVAGPMLEFSLALDSQTLSENARTKSQDHLFAISRRVNLDASTTDILLERGERRVVLSAAANPGARFSDVGFRMLVERAAGDDELAICAGGRRELPRHYLLKLLTSASEVVRQKLESQDPLSADAIRSAVAEASRLVRARTEERVYDFTAAAADIEALEASGQLDEQAVSCFAKDGMFEQAATALARMCRLPVPPIVQAMKSPRTETLIILAKAVGMSWPTVKNLLLLNTEPPGLSDHALDQCLGTYTRLKPSTAHQVLQFQQRRALANPAETSPN